MMYRVVFSSSLLATLGLVVMPATVMAQGTASHPSVYTASSMGELLAKTETAHTNMPLVSPKQLPLAALFERNTLPSGAFALLPGASVGSSDGVHRMADADKGVAPEAYGNYSPQSIAPYTTARASATILGSTPTAAAAAVTSYPWRAAGKLYFNIGSAGYVCSASMIAPGLLVTAAHCVYEYGTNSAAGWHTNFAFVPAQNTAGGTPPYGTWTAITETIASSYYDGTDSCFTKGVVCNNDIAIITMAPNASGQLPGNVVGWYGYGWNGYSFTPSFGAASLASITQLGYPVAFDSGMMMERNDGVGSYWSPGAGAKQTILGSAMTGGSSGGPWLVNFGTVPNVSSAASLGNSANSQVVEGVTSWGYTTVGHNTQGSSWFGQNTEFPNASYADSHGVSRGAGNIGALVAAACTGHFTHC
jgi:V8-like Glu-specific endopeptidase